MSKRIPCAFSSFASVAQSLQTMQWVRLVAGFLTLGHAAAKRESCVVRSSSSDSGVKS